MSKVSSQTKWNSAHPKELWAHSALRSALRKGLVVRGKCEVCGAENTDGHHDDYDRPMVVRWLCRLHHRHVHMKDRKTG
ncbi:hypothetical protein [Mesorhizobium muleiense]|uniref:hypothetical protein n=1 Tax=Mesorhizobium muleiense TaxID=1004279 RepID=UPI001F266D80|nr:hypothetical protein [Mesorhizobium muleiense]MCF6112391.1 hypothetical protein [Mesorhizobium muleiense]